MVFPAIKHRLSEEMFDIFREKLAVNIRLKLNLFEAINSTAKNLWFENEGEY